jgi:hypothetical protein
MSRSARPSPLSPTELVDEYFIENRTKLLDVAAFLDRLDRAAPAAADDFRLQAFREALAILADPTGGDRVERMQLLFSDPTDAPLEALDRKGALGAYDRWAGKGDRR